MITMLRLWYIFFFSATTIVAKNASDVYVSTKTLEDDNNVISHETPPTNASIQHVKNYFEWDLFTDFQRRSFTSYVPQCWSYRDYLIGRNEHFKSHFNVVIPHGGQFKVEYERGETCGKVKIVCLRVVISNTTVNDPQVDINTCSTNNLTWFNISTDTGECIPAVQCQYKALYDTKITLTASENDYRPLSVFSLTGEDLHYDGSALAEGRRTQALLTEHDVREYKDRADALQYASYVDSLLDEYDDLAGIDKSAYMCLEIQAWRSGPGGAPAANLPICPTVFVRPVPLSGVADMTERYLTIETDKGLTEGFLTSNPATSWLLLHKVAHVYDALTKDIHLNDHLDQVWHKILAGLYQARYLRSEDGYWLYDNSTEVENTLEILRSDVAFEDLDDRERVHLLIGLVNVDDDSSYLVDLYKRHYKNDTLHCLLEELVSTYLNRRVDPLPLMARVFSAERGNWFNITQFAQAISLNRRLSYDKDLNTFPKSVFSVTSAPIHLKTNMSFSPENCGTPYFTIDGVLFSTTTVVTRANSLVVCLDTPNISNSITNSTKFIYLTDMNVKENIVTNPVRVLAREGLKFSGYGNTWGHIDMRHDENILVFETYDIQPHSRFDTVYAEFTFFNESDGVIWHVSINGTETEIRHKELILSEVKKIQIYYAEPDKLKYARTEKALTRKKNSTFILNSPYSGNHIVLNPLHTVASEGFTFWGFANIWGFLDLRYDINRLVFKTYNLQPHSLFDTVYAHFTFFNHNDEVIWQVSINGTQRQKRYKEFILTEVKKIQIYYAEPEKLKYTQSEQALTSEKNSTLILNSPEPGSHIMLNPLNIMASEGFTFWGLGDETWGFLDLRYDINKLVFETSNSQPHVYFDTVYAHFKFFNDIDEVIWQVSIKGTERQKRHMEFILTEVKKIQIYYAEPSRLKYSRTKQAFSENTNSTLSIKPGCGIAETVDGRVDLLQRDVEHFVSVHYLSKFVQLFKQSCVQNTL